MASGTPDPRIARTRQKALDAAVQLLLSEGLERVTFDGVRKATGISRSTLYRHWNRPVDLMIDTWEQATRPADIPHTDDLRADVITALAAAAEFVDTNPLGRCLPGLIALANTDPDLADLHTRFTHQRRQALRRRLHQAITNDELPATTDTDQLIDQLIGPIFYRRLLRHTSTPTAWIRSHVDQNLTTNTHP